MGNWILVGASVLGLVSVVVIAVSLWSWSRPRSRPRPRPPQPTGSFAPLPPHSGSWPVVQSYAAPSQSYAALPSQSYPVVSPIQVAPPIQVVPNPPLAPPEAVLIQREQTQFMSTDEMFGRKSKPEPEQPDDDDEVPTQFMSDSELFGGQAEAPDPVVEPTVVLHDAWLAPTPAPRVRMPSAAEVRATTPERPLLAASIPRLPSPSPAQPPNSAANPGAIRTSRRSSDPRLAVPDPSEFVKPASDEGPTPYAGYVAPRRPGDDDDDDDDDDDEDPETQLVHQAELFRLMNKSKPP